MSIDTEAVLHHDTCEPIPTDYVSYGCRVNAIEVDALMRRYEEAGFLYPAKRKNLEPFLPEVLDNWKRALQAKEAILWIVTYDAPDGASWASLCSWRNTFSGWNTQHLVSIGSPEASRAVMLAACAVRWKRHPDTERSHQNWFRPENRFANKVFGSIEASIGPGASSVRSFRYVWLPVSKPKSGPPQALAVESLHGPSPDFTDFVRNVRGSVYLAAEELDAKDLLLDELDHIYRKVGLRRYRRIWLATVRGREGPVGAAIAYRGPLGLNFSFLENRCELLIEPSLDDRDLATVVEGLLDAAQGAYSGFGPGQIPVIADERTAQALIRLGGRPIRHYSQSIWLRSGYPNWYDHIDGFYARMARARKRWEFSARHPVM